MGEKKYFLSRAPELRTQHVVDCVDCTKINQRVLSWNNVRSIQLKIRLESDSQGKSTYLVPVTIKVQESTVGIVRSVVLCRKSAAKVLHNYRGAINLYVMWHSEGKNVGEIGIDCFVLQEAHKSGTWDKQPTIIVTPKSWTLPAELPSQHLFIFHRSHSTFCYLDPLLLPFNYRVITAEVYVPVSCFASVGISISSTGISDAPHVSLHLFFILTWFVANVITGLHLSCWWQHVIVQLSF